MKHLRAFAASSGPVRRAWLLVMAATAMLAASIIVAVWPHDSYDPLGKYPVQDVTSEAIPGEPSAFSDDDVNVTGTKCVDADHAVIVRGTVWWQTTDPHPGVFIESGHGSGVRRPGCTTFEFANTVPDEVAQTNRELIDKFGADEVRWQITGVETPIRADGFNGSSRPWRTEPFRLVP